MGESDLSRIQKRTKRTNDKRHEGVKLMVSDNGKIFVSGNRWLKILRITEEAMDLMSVNGINEKFIFFSINLLDGEIV